MRDRAEEGGDACVRKRGVTVNTVLRIDQPPRSSKRVEIGASRKGVGPSERQGESKKKGRKRREKRKEGK